MIFRTFHENPMKSPVDGSHEIPMMFAPGEVKLFPSAPGRRQFPWDIFGDTGEVGSGKIWENG
jgi:hypothetical protein